MSKLMILVKELNYTLTQLIIFQIHAYEIFD